jgi:mannose-6-phosphate isomerase-like protein (cupin superfamily)
MWETFIVQMGKGTIEVNQELIFIEAGDCVVVSPGESHEVKNTGVKEMKVLVIGEEI